MKSCANYRWIAAKNVYPSKISYQQLIENVDFEMTEMWRVVTFGVVGLTFWNHAQSYPLLTTAPSVIISFLRLVLSLSGSSWVLLSLCCAQHSFNSPVLGWGCILETEDDNDVTGPILQLCRTAHPQMLTYLQQMCFCFLEFGPRAA